MQGMRRPPLNLIRPTDQPSYITHGVGLTEVLNTSQPKSETPMASARDEDAETDTIIPDGDDHEQTRGDIQPVRVEMNDSTHEQENMGAINTTAPVDASSHDISNVDVGNRMDQSVYERGNGTLIVYSEGRQDDPSTKVGGSVMSAGTTSPKRTKKLFTERDVSLPQGRTRSKTGASKPHSDAPSF